MKQSACVGSISLEEIDPEIIFAIVRPIGTMSGSFRAELEGKLASYGYSASYIKLSDCITAYATKELGRPEPAWRSEDERVNGLMNLGNEICDKLNSRAAVAALGVRSISEARRLVSSGHQRIAYIIDSIKRVEEIGVLRQIYGDHIIVVGLQASLTERAEALKSILTPQLTLQPETIPEVIDQLIERDYKEPVPFGQGIMSAFPMADYFVDTSRPADPASAVNSSDIVSTQIGRLIDLIFGSPEYRDPTNEEFGMHLAWASSTRSTELGLRVGACIEGADGKILGLGYNSHPTRKGSPALDPSPGHIRDLLLDTMKLLSQEGLLSDDAVEKVRAEPDYMNELLDGPLKDAKLKGLIEFQHAIHAEMSALHRGLRAGAALDGATLYVTTYPCHNCAKHLMAVSLAVKYLEPYPKSKTATMYGQDAESLISPFTGVAPRRYHALFSVREDRKTPEGLRLPWTPQERKSAQPKVDLATTREQIAKREKAVLDSLSAG